MTVCKHVYAARLFMTVCILIFMDIRLILIVVYVLTYVDGGEYAPYHCGQYCRIERKKILSM